MKNPDNMTPEERLKRIRSLEKKVAELEWRLKYAGEFLEAKDAWAREAWTETRRCWELLTYRAKMKDDLAKPPVKLKVGDKVQLTTLKMIRGTYITVEDGRIGEVVEMRGVIDGGESALVVLNDMAKMWLPVTSLRRL